MVDELRIQEFKKAILFLKRKERIRSNTDVAVALDISSSYLSQIIHGNKPFSANIFEKFESYFKIDLNNPFSYTDLDWVTNQADEKNRSPDNRKELLTGIKKLLLLKEKETENQRKIINAQQLLINNLQKEIEMLRPFMK